MKKIKRLTPRRTRMESVKTDYKGGFTDLLRDVDRLLTKYYKNYQVEIIVTDNGFATVTVFSNKNNTETISVELNYKEGKAELVDDDGKSVVVEVDVESGDYDELSDKIINLVDSQMRKKESLIVSRRKTGRHIMNCSSNTRRLPLKEAEQLPWSWTEEEPLAYHVDDIVRKLNAKDHDGRWRGLYGQDFYITWTSNDNRVDVSIVGRERNMRRNRKLFEVEVYVDNKKVAREEISARGDTLEEQMEDIASIIKDMYVG